MSEERAAVSEEDAVVETENGERYEALSIDKSGQTADDR